jgi:hypothetical protein
VPCVRSAGGLIVMFFLLRLFSCLFYGREAVKDFEDRERRSPARTKRTQTRRARRK